MARDERLLEVRNLKTYFDTEAGVVKAVDGVSFHITRGETLAVVGESGSGKSVMSLSIMHLAQPGRFAGGQILLQGEDLLKKTEREMRRIRGNDVSMIFQEPMTSLNPVFTIGDQIAETISLHQRQSRSRAMRLAIEMLELVGIPEPARRATTYPHQMSGGMRQRAMIAMALSCGPKLLIADEPTTALDVTIQAQILDLMRKLQNDIGMSILFITHDLGVVAEVAEELSLCMPAKPSKRPQSRLSSPGRGCRTQSACSNRCPGSTGLRRGRSACGEFPAMCLIHLRCRRAAPSTHAAASRSMPVGLSSLSWRIRAAGTCRAACGGMISALKPSVSRRLSREAP